MKRLHYVLLTLIRGKGSNITKIISITLGLFVGILLFARVAFMMSFNTAYQESDKLCIIMAHYTIGGERWETPTPVVMGPVPRAIFDGFPDEVESVTVTQNWGEQVFYHGDTRFEGETIFGGSLYFQTMGINVLSGNVSDMKNPDVVFISQTLAKEIFGNDEPLGKTILHGKFKIELIVKGVFADVPENNSARPRAVISFATHRKYNFGPFRWGGGDSYQGYVRLRNADDMAKVNDRIKNVIEQYMPFQPEKGFAVEYHLENLHQAAIKTPDNQRMILLLSSLALVILLISAFNYVLISISSLPVRAKSIGVNKCSGATSGNIFSMFMWETGIIITLSLLLVVVLILNLQDMIEDIVEVSLGGLFSLQILWVPLLVILFLFLIAGVLPGRMFASVSVMQVFRRYTDKKKGWKHVLLFVQFAGVTFIVALMCIVIFQYKEIMNHDMGFNPERIATTYHRLENLEVGKSVIANLPMVESFAGSDDNMGSGYGGNMVKENGKGLFSARETAWDYDYVPLMGIEIVEGRNLMAPGEALINEEYVRRMRWTDSPLGKQAGGEVNNGIIVGVIKNFVTNSVFGEIEPIMISSNNKSQSWINVRLKEPFKENLKELNHQMKEIFPTSDVIFVSLQEQIDSRYTSVRRFRDTTIIAFISIFLITLMGLLGYVNDEVRRRSKEIAIRKVNGAKAKDILVLLSWDIIRTALPAILVGVIFAYFIAGKWLDMFKSINTSPSILIYLFVMIGVLLIILLCTVIKSWRVANENPVNSIKSE